MRKLSQGAALLRDRRFWVAVVSAAVVLTGLILWALRSYHRAQARAGLNEFAPFSNPALDLSFPRYVRDTDSTRTLLQPGVHGKFWTLHSRGGSPPSLEVRLTNQGLPWFSTVGDQIMATFKVGTREATRVLELRDVFPTRQVRFAYRWTELKPAGEVLGEQMPRLGESSEGEALFRYQDGQWRVMYWETPGYDEAVERFNALEPAPP